MAKTKLTFQEAAKQLKEIRQRPLPSDALKRVNDLMKKSEDELAKKDGEEKRPQRRIARDRDLEGEL